MFNQASPGPSGGTQSLSVSQSNSTGDSDPASLSIPKIEELNDENYPTWKPRITNILQLKGVWDVVVGKEVKPADHDAAEWDRKDLMGKYIIMNLVQNPQMTHINGCENSTTMWEVLAEIHEPKGFKAISHNRRVLHTTFASEDTDLQAHISLLKEARDHLGMVGHPVEETDFKYTILYSLPNSWRGYVSSFLRRSGATKAGNQDQLPNTHELISNLLDEYHRRQKSAGSNYACTSTSPTSSRRGIAPCPCAICGRINHTAAKCRYKGQPKCGICGKFGHTDDACWRNPINRGKGRISKGRAKSGPAL